MKYNILFCILLFAQNSFAVLLSSLLDEKSEQFFKTAHFSMFVQDAQSGEVIYQKNSEKYFSPASSMKLLPATAALLTLGEDYQYQTQMGMKQGDLYFKFSGDPSLTVEDIDALVEQIKLKKIAGDIVVDTSFFKTSHVARGTSYEDLGWYYVAKTPAVILNENALSTRFNPDGQLGDVLKVRPLEKEYGIQILSSAKLVTAQDAREKCRLNIQQELKNKIFITGCWPIDKKNRLERLSVPNPLLWFEHVLRTKLKKYHVRFSGVIKKGVWNKQVTLIKAHASSPLSSLLKHMMYESDNIYADSVMKTMAAEKVQHGNLKSAVTFVKQLFREKLKVSFSEALIDDGTGSRFNLVTTKQFSSLLRAIYQNQSLKQKIFGLMPLSCTRGSLQERMCLDDLKGHVFAKTGTMHDASSLTGYIVLPNKRTLLFSMVVNNYLGDIHQAKQAEDALVETIWDHYV